MRSNDSLTRLAQLFIVVFVVYFSIAAINSVSFYDVTRGNTASAEAKRGIDNWVEFPEAGIDCSGTTDSTRALQAAINTMPNDSTLKAPAGCTVKLSSTISITNRSGISIVSDQRPEDGSPTPEFIWSGSNAGPMFLFTYVTRPTIRGFTFNDPSPCALTGFLQFDGNGGSPNNTPTLALVEYNSFLNCTPSNVTFNAISISPTATTNHENYRIENNDFYCGQGYSDLRSQIGVVDSGSPTLYASDGAFTPGDVGKRLLVSWATGSLNTTVLSIVDRTNIVMSTNAPSSQSNVTVHIGQAYGTGIFVGANSNAKDHKYVNNRFSQCAYGLHLKNGSYDIRHIAGTRNDTMIYAESISEPSAISFYQAEYDLRFLEFGPARSTIAISNTRIDNYNQRADGYIYFEGIANVVFSGANNETAPRGIQTNAVLFGFVGASGYITSVSNYYHPIPWAQVNLMAAGGYISMNDVVHPDTTLGIIVGNKSLPKNSSGLPTGQLWNNSGVINVAP